MIGRRRAMTVTGAQGTEPVSRIKRWIALIGAVGIAMTLLVVFGVISFAVSQTGNGSDPDRAFSPTQAIPGALTVGVTWAPDADDLVREVELTTRELLGSMWLRADDALGRAALGDVSGLEVWFVDAALAGTQGRFAAPQDPEMLADGARPVVFEVAPALGHRLRVDFYSLDGQVVVFQAQTIRLRPTGPAGDTVEVLEQLEVMAVLSDGNWRVRHLERLTPRFDDDVIPT